MIDCGHLERSQMVKASFIINTRMDLLKILNTISCFQKIFLPCVSRETIQISPLSEAKVLVEGIKK